LTHALLFDTLAVIITALQRAGRIFKGAIQMEPREPDRRKQKRIHFIKEVEVVGVGVRRCSDLSTDGMYLETVHSVPVGTLCDLQFKLSDTDPQPIKVQGRVIYVHDGVGMGLSFVNLKPEDSERIKQFVRIKLFIENT
jgi:hypothetical protein